MRFYDVDWIHWLRMGSSNGVPVNTGMNSEEVPSLIKRLSASIKGP